MSMSEVEWLEIFSGNLKSLMEGWGYTQSELADETGLSASAINRYLKGTMMPTAKSIVKLASAFECSTDDLIDFGDNID